MVTGRTASGRAAQSGPGASYLRLIRRLPLRPLQTAADLDRAVTLIDELLDRKDLDSGEQDYLDVLGDLIERYEEMSCPMPAVSDGEMLAFLMEQKGVRQVVVARAAGIAESTVSEILAGRRRLNRAQIERLAAYFRVEPGVFLGGRQVASA